MVSFQYSKNLSYRLSTVLASIELHDHLAMPLCDVIDGRRVKNFVQSKILFETINIFPCGMTGFECNTGSWNICSEQKKLNTLASPKTLQNDVMINPILRLKQKNDEN